MIELESNHYEKKKSLIFKDKGAEALDERLKEIRGIAHL